MSEQTSPADDHQEWPEDCPTCGTRLQQVAVDFAADSPDEVGATADVAAAVFEDRCPNPECPAHQAGGPAGTSNTEGLSGTEGSNGTAGGSLGDRQPDRPTMPGSLGGDNGGA